MYIHIPTRGAVGHDMSMFQMRKPDTSIEDGWRAEGATDALIQSRISMASTASSANCQQRVKREAEISVKPLDETWMKWKNVGPNIIFDWDFLIWNVVKKNSLVHH